MTWTQLKEQLIADFKAGQLSLIAFGILLAILQALEREGFAAPEERELQW